MFEMFNPIGAWRRSTSSTSALTAAPKLDRQLQNPSVDTEHSLVEETGCYFLISKSHLFWRPLRQVRQCVGCTSICIFVKALNHFVPRLRQGNTTEWTASLSTTLTSRSHSIGAIEIGNQLPEMRRTLSIFLL